MALSINMSQPLNDNEMLKPAKTIGFGGGLFGAIGNSNLGNAMDVAEELFKDYKENANSHGGGSPEGNFTSESNNEEIKEEEIKKEEIKEEENAYKWLEEAYKREDEIRKETQEREDTAYQRAVEDMRKAGINPNIFAGAGASASGGGITNASRADLTLLKSKYEKGIEMLMQEIQNQFQGDENTKDRLTKIFDSFLKFIKQD